MSGASARVATRWWSENRFLTLDPDAQRILFLLWTAPETALCGLTPLSPALIAERLRLKPGTVRSRLAQLEDREFIKLDPDAPLCWIKGYVELQLGGVPATSKPWLSNTATAVAGLPQTAMVNEFKAAYSLPDHVPKQGKKAGSPRGAHRDPGRDPGRGPGRGPTRGAPIRSLGVGVAPDADPTAKTGIGSDLPSIAEVAVRDYLDHAMHDTGRIELRHQDGDRWVSGLFDDIGALRMAIHSRAGSGNLFTTINAPRLMPVSNAMHDRALADADIVLHTRLVFDFDPVRPIGVPSTDAEMQAAVAARDRLVAALLSIGWPQPATAMSGNGAHAIYRWRTPVCSTTTEMLACLYRGLKRDFGTADVDFDTTVRNPARIWRLYGTTNRKGTPIPTRPHRTFVARIPGRWGAVSPQQVEQLAASYARQPQQVHERAAVRVAGAGDYSTLDATAWFKAHGYYRRHVDGDRHAVRCPWDHEHSTVDGEHSTATVIWAATGRCWPNFRCLHAHCDGRGIRDVMTIWGDADDFCGRSWRTAP